MHVLVTGGTGALGREVVRRLIDEGHRARVLSRKHAEGDPVSHADRFVPRRHEQAASYRVGALHVAVPTRRHHRGGGAIGGHCDASQAGRHDARFRRPGAKRLQEPGDVLARGPQARQATGQSANAVQAQPPVLGRRGPGSRTSRRHHYIRAIFGTEVSQTHMNKFVDRYGRTGVAAITSIVWLLPFAAWAGAADLSPIDRSATPTIAFTIGVVMLALWLVLLAPPGPLPVAPPQRRLHLRHKS